MSRPLVCKIIDPRDLDFKSSPLFKRAYLAFLYRELRIPGFGIINGRLVNNKNSRSHWLVTSINISQNRQSLWGMLPFNMGAIHYSFFDPISQEPAIEYSQSFTMPWHTKPQLFEDNRDGIETENLELSSVRTANQTIVSLKHDETSAHFEFNDLSAKLAPQKESYLHQPYTMGSFYKHKHWLELSGKSNFIALGGQAPVKLNSKTTVYGFEDIWMGFPPSHNDWDWVCFTGKTSHGRDVRIIAGKNCIRRTGTPSEQTATAHLWISGKYTALPGQLDIEYSKENITSSWNINFFSGNKNHLVIWTGGSNAHPHARPIDESFGNIFFKMDWIGYYVPTEIELKLDGSVILAKGLISLESNREFNRGVY